MNEHRRRWDRRTMPSRAAARQRLLFAGELPPLKPPPTASGSATSGLAAAAIAPHAGRQAQVVLDWLAAHAGSTREQIAAGCGLGLASVCARVNALLAAGRILVLDTRGRTQAGRAAERLAVR